MSRCPNLHVGKARDYSRLPHGLSRRDDTAPCATLDGELVRCYPSHNGVDLAVKVTERVRAERHGSIEGVFTENAVLKASANQPHPNLLASYSASNMFAAAPGTLVSITPWLDGGELFCVLEAACNAGVYMPLQDVLRYTMDVVSGVGHLHTHLGYAHLDISPENVMLHSACSGDAPHAVVVDFGCAAAIGDDGIAPVTRRGKDFYMAPEVQIATSPVTIDATRADVYSIGVMLLVLLTGRTPPSAWLRRKSECDLAKELASHWPERCGSGRAELIASMVSANPASRPTLKEVASHRGLAWLQQDASVEAGTQVLEAGAGAGAEVGGGAGAGAGAGSVIGGVAGNNDLGDDIIGSDELLLAFIREVPSPQPAGAHQEV